MALTAAEQNVINLEKEHKNLFWQLAVSNNTYLNLQKKYMPIWNKDKNYLKSPSWKTVTALGGQILVKAHHWFETQKELEAKAKIPKTNITENDFLQPKKNLAIQNQNLIYFTGHGLNGGIGIIPLIIWGVVLIVGAISAAYIASRLTVSTQDRVDLLAKTAQTCKDLNLTPDECANVVSTVQTQETKNSQGVTDVAKSLTGGVENILLLGGGLLLAFTFLKNKNK
jgi:hypothetical protein